MNFNKCNTFLYHNFYVCVANKPSQIQRLRPYHRLTWNLKYRYLCDCCVLTLPVVLIHYILYCGSIVPSQKTAKQKWQYWPVIYTWFMSLMCYRYIWNFVYLEIMCQILQSGWKFPNDWSLEHFTSINSSFT
jgi:hypothetical protein